jgi:CHASE2 domain-containing sensor protein
MNRTPEHWRHRVIGFLTVLLAVAYTTHVVANWLMPLVPAAIAFVVVLALIGFLTRRR